MDFYNELGEIAKEIENDNEKVASDILDVADEFQEIKNASLINFGDKIINVNPIQGLIKGRSYICGDIVAPNYGIIKEQTGDDVGIFRLDRFVLENGAV
jgi:hypothetical protein